MFLFLAYRYVSIPSIAKQALTYTYIHTYIHIHKFIHTSMHGDINPYTYKYTHTYRHTHTYIHTCIHTHRAQLCHAMRLLMFLGVPYWAMWQPPKL